VRNQIAFNELLEHMYIRVSRGTGQVSVGAISSCISIR